MARAKSATIALNVRMKEPLRAQLEKTAKERGVSLNAEVVNRLERTFQTEAADDRVLASVYEQFGGKELFEFAKFLTGVINMIEVHCGGRSFLTDPQVAKAARQAVDRVWESIAPESEREGLAEYGEEYLVMMHLVERLIEVLDKIKLEANADNQEE